MRIAKLHRAATLAVAAVLTVLASAAPDSRAQSIVVLVNDEPITSGDIAQRTRWMARTSGFGDRMKALLTGNAVKERFRQLMVKANPRSQAEAEQAAERIKGQLIEEAKARVLSEGGGTSRKQVIETLIEDKLKLQAAKTLKITISDKEVEEVLGQRAGGGSGKKPLLNEFYQQFEADGISRKTVKNIIRAQLAWRDVIRRQYGPRIAAMIASAPSDDSKTADGDIQFDVRVLRLAVAGSDQRAVSQRMMEAENLRAKFTSCADLPKRAKLVADASVKAVHKAKLASFNKDAQPLILKAAEGQMTPPILVSGAVESYAICKKGVVAKKTVAEEKPDARQQEFERFSRRYLYELRKSASIDYRTKVD
ncbi:SurA N-terminal domain-containing protein [Rhodomicrobium sp. Az07]|uniref:SurA N-terminal domain-containing protein n=1 Tax=Rhodomicrobium sp. Az07 TaxID=2839034 RepID=UPI001BEAAC02|nr:SurA N-terminal domain-containing protein [Rhodomicrobium sp. Az07]MBT3069869.1 SurA N-terminal domain-containing protein [Rhodomicrobium sp. Az07]